MRQLLLNHIFDNMKFDKLKSCMQFFGENFHEYLFGNFMILKMKIFNLTSLLLKLSFCITQFYTLDHT